MMERGFRVVVLFSFFGLPGWCLPFHKLELQLLTSSLMAARIGAIWEQGEELVSDGDYLEGLLMFQRAKTMLIAESKEIYSAPNDNNKRASKLFGDIMVRLSASIDKNIAILSRNPIMTLKLTRGFNKKDVKKAYRSNALKYHPDKNTDCDSSSVFTLVQSAYETLLTSAPEAPRSPNSRSGPRNTPRESQQEVKKAVPANTSTANDTSSFIKRSNKGVYVRPDDEGATQKAYRLAGRDSATTNYGSSSSSSRAEKDPEKTKSSSTIDKKSQPYFGSKVSAIPSDDLREILAKLGFLRVESMERDELVKKYLAVNAHLKDPR